MIFRSGVAQRCAFFAFLCGLSSVHGVSCLVAGIVFDISMLRTAEEAKLRLPLRYPAFALQNHSGSRLFPPNSDISNEGQIRLGGHGRESSLKGVASAHQLGSNRIIMPVKLLGSEDGTWNRAARRHDTFYGNSFAGFTSAP